MTTLGPDSGHLRLLTTREGLAGRIGHDLTIEVGDWSADFDVEGERLTRLSVTAKLGSLTVLEGTGGLKPLSDGDRKNIVTNALKTLQANNFPEIVFVAAGPVDLAPELVVPGRLTIAGRTNALDVTVTVVKGIAAVRAEVRQTDFGVKPYSAMLGQLKVTDVVTVAAELVLPN